MQTVPMTRNGLALGKQRVHILAPGTAFRITALPDADAKDQEYHLRSLLRYSPLEVIQWLNMVRHRVDLVTLVK